MDAITVDGSQGRQKDLAVLPRAQLIRGGFEAIGRKESTEAIYYFGAAIRKARKVQMYDVEAEYYKFVTLYLEGDYSGAVNRVVECLDGVKLVTDMAKAQGIVLPQAPLAERLTACLSQAMVMRRDTYFQLAGHFWQAHMGEYYLLKRTVPLLAALAKAWMVISSGIRIGYDYLGDEVKPYTKYLQDQLDSAKDMIEGGEGASPAGSAIREPGPGEDSSDREAEVFRARENHYVDFLQKVQEVTIMGLSHTQIEELHELCRHSRNVTNLGTLARVIDQLGPNSKKSYLAALADNDLMRSRDTRLADKDAERLHAEVLEYQAKLEAS